MPPKRKANVRAGQLPTSEQELEWDPLGESTELLAESVEDLTSSMQNGIDTNTNVTNETGKHSTRPVGAFGQYK
uniref:Uncharacterized protein n=1 Tax=Timema bartmani TaxID=61472 RepID=A0A7R9F8Q9_9NEOP|nr:unnamed protein product [Timema bartmani]